MDTAEIELTSLLWDNILFANVLPYLTLKDLFTLRGLSKECKRLVESYFAIMKELNFNGCSFVSTTGFLVLSNSCKNLRILKLCYCNWITDDLIKSILSGNKLLSYIDLSGCENLSCVCLQPAIIFCKDLKCLLLKRCHWMSTGCLEALALHQTKLEVLSLGGCSNLGDVTVINNLLARCHELHTLDLSGIPCVSDSTLETIAHCNLKLQYLNIRCCDKVTNYGVKMVSEYCRELLCLIIEGCCITADSRSLNRNICVVKSLPMVYGLDLEFSQRTFPLHLQV